MQFKEIRKVHEGKFITRYDIDYELVDGNTKTYEMISRTKDLKNEHDVVDAPIDSVILMLTDEAGERLLLDREFRLATGRFVYNFPAGLIDPGETPEEAAARELREETGITASEFEYLGPFYPTCAYSTEVIYLYWARGLSFGDRELDEDESINVEMIGIREFADMILEGKVPDGKTQAAVLNVLARMQKDVHF